jgi:hypothetical protein
MVVGAALLVGGMLLVPAGAGATGKIEVGARSGLVPHGQSHSKESHSKHGVIGVGSTWTLYEAELSGFTEVCEVLTFVSKSTFTGDLGDTGTWSKNVTLTFDTSGAGPFGGYDPGLVYKMKYFSFATAFNGAGTQGSIVADAGDLNSGFDPFEFGTC